VETVGRDAEKQTRINVVGTHFSGSPAPSILMANSSGRRMLISTLTMPTSPRGCRVCACILALSILFLRPRPLFEVSHEEPPDLLV
jgi:hypothetical protein